MVSLAASDKEIDVWECAPELVVATDPVSHPRDEWSGVLNVPAKFSIVKRGFVSDTGNTNDTAS